MNSKSFAERKFTRNFLVIEGIFLVLFYSIYWPISDYIRFPQKRLAFIVGFLVLSYPVYWISKRMILPFADPFFDKLVNNIFRSARGIRGEVGVERGLREILDKKEYTIISNFPITEKSDIDFLVVGPKGLILIEVKNNSAKQILTPQKNFYLDENGNKKSSSYEDPRDQVERHASELKHYLAAKGFLDVRVKKVLIFASKCELEDYRESKNKVFVVSGTEKIKEYFDKAYPDKKFTPEFCAEIKKSLSNE